MNKKKSAPAPSSSAPPAWVAELIRIRQEKAELGRQRFAVKQCYHCGEKGSYLLKRRAFGERYCCGKCVEAYCYDFHCRIEKV